MAESKGKGKIQDLSAVAAEVDGEEGKMEVAPGVQSVTTETPHPADESSAPGPYGGLTTERPPVSTSRPDVPIAHSLVGGAGAPSPEPEYHPEWGPDQEPDLGAQKAAEEVAKAEEKK